jgi:hypothetical protein
MDTLGGLIDKLCTVDLKMWNNQELLYEIRRMTFDEFEETFGSSVDARRRLFVSLAKACDLNVQRNALIDEIDERVCALTGAQDDGRNVQRKHKTY